VTQISAENRASRGLRGRSLSGTITRADPIARRMRRIRIEGDEVSRLAWTPGQHVRVHVLDIREPRNWLRPRDMLRAYSVWDYDGGLELCVLDHGGGDDSPPGARWAREAAVGQRVTFNRPEGSLVLRDAPYHLFAGDETAAVAFGPMLRALPAQAPAYGVIEVDEEDDQLPLGRDVRWLYRHGSPAAASRSLAGGLARLDLPAGPGIAYLAGEARTIQMLRRQLVEERGWPRQAVVTKPFWTPGKRGLE
jgi:NADPH-dependent ferric siderophore reductase